MDVPASIRNHEAVVGFFGCWPSFHDANVVAYEAGADSLGATLHTWLMTDLVDAKGYFIRRNHAPVPSSTRRRSPAPAPGVGAA